MTVSATPLSDDAGVNDDYLVTIDAEQAGTLVEGISVISAIRDQLEREEGIEIPLVWLVRFQRSWDEYLGIDSPGHFEGPVDGGFDGFDLANDQLRAMRDRGDEIGWHYHATGYVHRPDLTHETRLQILNADLMACGSAIRERYPEFDVTSFRFGWFFIPDYAVFKALYRAGIRVDASVNPNKQEGSQVAVHDATYLAPLTETPAVLHGVYLVPFVNTILTHDWSVVPHEVSWRSHDEAAANERIERFRSEIRSAARNATAAGGSIITYAPFLRARDTAPVLDSGAQIAELESGTD